ncbi:coiled-coil domain containing 169 [Lamellibrachia satsuma]|nr:coiled-coil domain containing 169 [Lamellibrachia satsuma]
MDDEVEGKDGDVYEIDRLRADLSQELQMKEMLEQSLGELQITVQELQKKVDSVDDENNEWKTRFESQTAMNEQLEKQILLLQERQTEARNNIRENRFPNKTPRDDEKQATAHFVRQLEKEQQILENQMRDLEWRLDQESKAYHKAIEEKKQHGIEIQAAKGLLTHSKLKRSTGTLNYSKDGTDISPRPIGNANIQPDQRIIEARRGPIKKTAAVRNLPKLQ